MEATLSQIGNVPMHCNVNKSQGVFLVTGASELLFHDLGA
jgi:hypothetical protein